LFELRDDGEAALTRQLAGRLEILGAAMPVMLGGAAGWL
jgi:hypothetical protein